MTNEILNEVERAYAQAKKYGQELAKLYGEEKARRQELETTTQKLQAIFDTAPNALAVIDHNLTLTEANPRFLMLLEADKTCVGQSLSVFLPCAEIEDAIACSETWEAGIGHVEIEVSQPILRSILVTLAPLSNDLGWVLILHDLTERKRLEGLKEEFVNIAAHELRTPLAGVIGFVGVLQEELRNSDNPMAENLMELILQSTQRLKTIIDELVSFAATHREGSISLHITNIDLNWLLSKTVKFLQETITEKQINCQLELPNSPVTIQGDQFILSEVMYQLIKNAATFNKSNGEIFIRIQHLPLSMFPDIRENINVNEQEQNVTVIEIEDTGIGIPQTAMAKIFDRFYQVEEHLTRGIGGLGLGLTIASHGVEQHGGQIQVSSELDKGSTFRVVLPYITELIDVSIDNRVDVAYQQTLIYAKDIARAIASERKIGKRMNQINDLGQDLDQKLQQLTQLEPDSSGYLTLLNKIQQLTRQIKETSTPQIAK